MIGLIIRDLNELHGMVYRLLSSNRLFRNNDTALIFEVCRLKGYCTYTVVNGRRCFVFFDDNDMPRGFFESVRRTRQKLQQCYSELSCDPEMKSLRVKAEKNMRLNI